MEIPQAAHRPDLAADTRVEHIGSVIRLCVRKKAAEADKQKEAQPTFGRLCLFFCLCKDRIVPGAGHDRRPTTALPPHAASSAVVTHVDTAMTVQIGRFLLVVAMLSPF